LSVPDEGYSRNESCAPEDFSRKGGKKVFSKKKKIIIIKAQNKNVLTISAAYKPASRKILCRNGSTVCTL
jgi:hypothetical protein